MGKRREFMYKTKIFASRYHQKEQAPNQIQESLANSTARRVWNALTPVRICRLLRHAIRPSRPAIVLLPNYNRRLTRTAIAPDTNTYHYLGLQYLL